MAAPSCEPPTERVLPSLQPFRCWRCGRLLARVCIPPGGTVEIKCASCNALNLAQAPIVDKSGR